jgi:hypothetical protein
MAKRVELGGDGSDFRHVTFIRHRSFTKIPRMPPFCVTYLYPCHSDRTRTISMITKENRAFKGYVSSQFHFHSPPLHGFGAPGTWSCSPCDATSPAHSELRTAQAFSSVHSTLTPASTHSCFTWHTYSYIFEAQENANKELLCGLPPLQLVIRSDVILTAMPRYRSQNNRYPAY